MHRYENVGGQEPVTLICRADGNPEADVTWYKENNIVNRSKSSSSVHITIMNPTTYTCLAWNELGKDLQHVVFLQGRCITWKILLKEQNTTVNYMQYESKDQSL